MPDPRPNVGFIPITIATIDRAMRDWFDKVVDAHVIFPGNDRRKVTVVIASGERWAMSHEQKGIRDQNGVLILPVISIRRSGIEPSAAMSAPAAETPTLTLAKRIDGKTNRVKNLVAQRGLASKRLDAGTVYEVTTIPFPDFSIMSYEIIIQTSFISHMNAILEKIFHSLDIQKSFAMPIDHHRHDPKAEGQEFEDRKSIPGGYFVGFMDTGVNPNDNLEEFTDQQRIIKYTTTCRVPAPLQLDPEGTKPSPTKEYTSFKLGFGDEKATFVDDPDELEIIFGKR